MAEDSTARSAQRLRQDRLALLLLVMLMALQIGPWWQPGDDSALYLTIARNLAMGRGYVGFDQKPVSVAPLYPVLLSPTFRLADHPFIFISLIQFALACVLTLGLLRWFRCYEPRDAMLLTFLVMVNTATWWYYRRALTEFLFMALLVWTMVLLDRSVQARDTRRSLASATGGALLLAAVAMTRLVGVFAAPGFAAAMILDAWRGRRRWPAALAAVLLAGLPLAVLILVVLLVVQATQGPQARFAAPYIDPVLNQLSVAGFVEGVRLRISEVGRLTVPGMFKSYSSERQWLHATTFIYLPIFVLTVTGVVILAWKRSNVWAWTALFYALFFCFWPFDQNVRFMLPMLPVLWLGLWVVAGRWPNFRRYAAVVLVVLHLLVSIGYGIRDITKAVDAAQEWPMVRQVAQHVGADPIAVHGISSAQQAMLRFELGRRELLADDPTAIPGDVLWLLAPPGTASPAFEQAQRFDGGLILYRRVSPAPEAFFGTQSRSSALHAGR